MSNLTNHIDSLVQISLATAQADNALTPLLVHQAVLHMAHANAEQVNAIKSNLASIAQSVNSLSPSEMPGFFAQAKTELERNVGRAIDNALIDGSIFRGADRFVSSYSPLQPSLAEVASAWLGQKVQDAGSPTDAQNIIDVAKAAVLLQPGDTTIIAFASPTIQRIYDDIVADKNIDTTLGQGAVDYIDETKLALGRELALSLNGGFKPIVDFDTQIQNLQREPVSASASPVSAQWLAGANFLQTVLRAGGANGAANEVATAVGYAQTACQVYQCASVLIAGASGWGAVMAVSGLSSGISGLGSFGTRSGAPDSQAPVLLAIQNLLVQMKKEFAQVNAKLDDIIDLLDKVIQGIRDVKWELKEIQRQLAKLEEQVNNLILSMPNYFLESDKNHILERNGDYQAYIRNKLMTKERMAESRAFYANVATFATQSPFVISPPSFEEAQTELKNGYLAEANVDPWQYQSHLLMVLTYGFGIHVQGAPVSEPILRIALEGYADVCMSDEVLFRKLNGIEQDEQIESIRATSLAHKKFMEGLRQFSNGSQITPINSLLEKYTNQIDIVKNVWLGATEAAWEQYKQGIEDGNGTPLTRQSGSICVNGLPDNQFVLFNSSYFGQGSEKKPRPISNLFCTFTPSSALEIPFNPLQLEIINWVYHDIDKYGNDPRYKGSVTCCAKFCGDEIPGTRFDIDLMLYIKQEKDYLVNKYDLISLLANADGAHDQLSGIEPLVDRFNGLLTYGPVIDWVKQQHRYRLATYMWTLHTMIATTLSQQLDHPVRVEIARLESIVHAIRGLSRLVYSDSYNACDALQTLFGSRAASCLIDTRFLQTWIELMTLLKESPTTVPQVSPQSAIFRMAQVILNPNWNGRVPDTVHDPVELSNKRAPYLSKAVELFFNAGAHRQPSFEITRAIGLFEHAVHLIQGDKILDKNVLNASRPYKVLLRGRAGTFQRHTV